jgi:hypothetical protein
MYFRHFFFAEYIVILNGNFIIEKRKKDEFGAIIEKY